MAEIAATFGFAAGLVVGFAIAQIREAGVDHELAREFWRRQGDPPQVKKAARMAAERIRKQETRISGR